MLKFTEFLLDDLHVALDWLRDPPISENRKPLGNRQEEPAYNHMWASVYSVTSTTHRHLIQLGYWLVIGQDVNPKHLQEMGKYVMHLQGKTEPTPAPGSYYDELRQVLYFILELTPVRLQQIWEDERPQGTKADVKSVIEDLRTNLEGRDDDYKQRTGAAWR